jgi:DNA-binding NarL/FixJ family response regulator
MTNLVAVKDLSEFKAVERHIIRGIVAGFTNKEIATSLGLKTGTVGNYISGMLHKTGLQHRTQIAILALESGYIDKNFRSAP